LVCLLLFYATAVKTPFVPVAVAVLTLEILKAKPKFFRCTVQAIVALGGYLAFGLYSYFLFGDFFLSTKMTIAEYGKEVGLFNLIDLTHYADRFEDINAKVAFISLFFLFALALKFAGSWRNARPFFKARAHSRQDIPIEMSLWWIALAYTAFCVMGDSHGALTFASIMRYQTFNIPIFLLMAYQMRTLPWWQSICLAFPICWISIVWQNAYTVGYWRWAWIS
jgi:hypothetical protein